MMKHTLGMLLGCGGAILLLFLLPSLGVGGNVTFIVFIVVMLACHLMMGGLHSHGRGDEKTEKYSKDRR